MIYLNSTDGDLELLNHRIESKKGQKVIFHQDLVHRGLSNSNLKYFMRSEFMYTRNPSIETEQDRQAIRLLQEARQCYYTHPEKSQQLEKEAFQLSPEIEKLIF